MATTATASFGLINRIRWHINRTEKQVALLTSHEKWAKLTSALNVLEDTACAIEYYRNTEYPSDINGKYLFTYGLIQALYVQCHAINSISESLFSNKINFKNDYPDVYRVYEIRDDVVGHPTDRKNKQFIYLAQHSMEKGSFYYTIVDGESGTYKSIEVSVVVAIDDVTQCVNNILDLSVKELDREFIEYVDKHKERKMKEIFNNLGYAREKVLLNTDMKQYEYEATKKMVSQCKKEIIERYGSVETSDVKDILTSIHVIYNLIDKELSRIPCDLVSQIETCLQENLFSKLERLKKYCEETDSYFENYGENPIELSDVHPDVKITGMDGKEADALRI
jgi:hypothetical protein